MGWPPCGKTMVHWFSTKERGLVVSVWNMAHNVGGALVATFALVGVMLFGDWGAKFYFNALIAAVVAIVVFFLMRRTRRSRAACLRSRSTRTTIRPIQREAKSKHSGTARSSSNTC